ncbi:DNA-binding transcriptional response regulator, NtrC family, contains REC, AAA-type ATPase, and a Fis-type DNA-binding domains [Flavobacteriaceae bacterium MAR_2010_188]|nr:DNA-binding transcriptional response regulator, NtrC family, contains REC, AAA-type ATPase, and a Fis-type DNA-binding domains [Flavobacteriaceae bacterium MAR_2010_188]
MLLKDANILVIDDDEDVLTALRLLLKSLAKSVVVNKNPNTLQSLLEQNQFDLVILDMNFNGVVNTGNEGIFWLKKVKEHSQKIDVILITAYGDIDLAIRSLKEGASDFMVKPWKNEKLVDSISQLLSKKKAQKSQKINTAKGKIIGDSEVMQDVFIKINKVAPTDANILILGENGTGKDLIAQAIHENSNRKNKPFVKVDVGSLTSNLFESELFGYKKGAFTGANENRMGRFEAANGGTMFLDEIGNISLSQQARLLSVLQNRQVTPLGSNDSISLDIRLICATNLSLPDLADENKFRKDLIYRINTVDIMVPPLRDRGADITLISHYFIDIYAEKYFKGPFKLDTSFIRKLKEHSFPGNVRELQYSLERSVIMAEGQLLKEDDLVFSAIERNTKSNKNKTMNLETLEKNAILSVIEKNNGNISKSAKELGITRTALYRRLNKYDL